MSGKILVGLFVGLSIVNVTLLFLVVHDRWFYEEPEGAFLLTALDAATLRIGQVIVLISLLIGFYAGVMPSTETLEQRLLDFLHLVTRGGLALAGLTLALTVSGSVLGYLFFSSVRFYPRISQGSSAVLITPDGAELYVALPDDGAVLWKDLAAPHAKNEIIPIGKARDDSSQSIQIGQETAALWTPGEPSQLAYVAQTDEVLVTDVKFNSVVVISRRTHRPVHIISGVGFAPRAIVVTPDGHKAYVSSEQPIPTGQIAVIDLLAKPYPQLKEKKISVPSPEGMAIIGRRLYVATQSGASHDAVFVVNTATDEIMNWQPGFAVGVGAAIVGQAGEKLYVTRGNFPLPGDPKKSPVGVIDISGSQLEARPSISLDFNTTLIAATEDGHTALVANGLRLTAIDAINDRVQLSAALGGAPTGLAISNNRVYAWLPTVPQLLTFDLRSLLPGKPK